MIDTQQLTNLVRAHIPTRQITITPITTGKFNASYWVHADGTELVMRIAPAHSDVFLFYERLI